ncbi:MAG: hypothetical protein EAZ12_02135 [Sphingobacteriia bacterium]|nr:MAG: hypothetical protein EAZ12_02135 [Sphingobacteriia bacterium]
MVSCNAPHKENNFFKNNIEKIIYRTNPTTDEAKMFFTKHLQEDFTFNSLEGKTWIDFYQHYQNVVNKHKSKQSLGYFKHVSLQYLFVKGSGPDKILFEFKNNSKHQEVLNYYADELMSLDYQDPLISKNLVEYLKLFWSNEKLSIYVKKIVENNKQIYDGIKNGSNRKQEIEALKAPEEIKKKFRERETQNISSIDYLTTFEIN